jgi:hypothetical protein
VTDSNPWNGAPPVGTNQSGPAANQERESIVDRLSFLQLSQFYSENWDVELALYRFDSRQCG